MRGPEEYTKTVRIGHSIEWMARNYVPKRGVNIQVVAIRDLDHATDETICNFIVNALNPYFPRYRQDIESEIDKLRVIEERVKSQSDYNKVSHPQAKARTSTIIDSILEELEDSPLDHQLKRARNVVRLPNGKHMGRIWGQPNNPERSNDRY